MGLKTTNYEVKELGIILPQAYAVIGELHADRIRNYAYATFFIQANRTATLDKNKKPLEKVDVEFPLNMAEDHYKTAYKTAKKEITVKDENGNVVQTVRMPFYGWQDDIV